MTTRATMSESGSPFWAAALGRAAWERVQERRGYRHGTSPRALVTGEGPVQLAVPRARLVQADGTTHEWHTGVLPKRVEV